MGAWIETHNWLRYNVSDKVAPLVGAWIETFFRKPDVAPLVVAPLVGAWIETEETEELRVILPSHPSWVRGLKLIGIVYCLNIIGRTPRGCVD